MCRPLIAFLVICCFATAHAQYTWADWTPLDEYVQSDDGYFEWTELAQYDYTGVTVYVVNMTSQKWMDETYVNHPVWWHIMGIAVPENIQFPRAGFIYITGGSNKDDTEIPPYDDEVNLLTARLANDTGTVGAYLQQVPNEPLVFVNDPLQKSRSEDAIIAWTWRTYLDAATKDPTVILRMPMTKAGKRGLDTIHEVAKKKRPETNIDRFLVAGASKRGWTTWSLACTDRRVIALLPLVFSMLKIENTLQNHFQDMDGAWSFAFSDYWNENLTAEVYNPEVDGVWDVEDMYRYRARLEGIPKIAMSSSGDEFFLLDDNHQWWDEMPEPKWLMMLPNAEHTMAPWYVKLYETAAAFWSSVLQGIPLPEVTWSLIETELGGLIVVETRPQPINITSWAAVTLENDTRRDYRLAAIDETIGEVWVHPVRWYEDIVPVIDFGNGYEYGAAAEKVDGEWLAYFIEMTWAGPAPFYYNLKLTTQVNIIPFTWPRGPCLTNDECYGYLV